MADALRSVFIFTRSKDTAKPVAATEATDSASDAPPPTPNPRSDASKIEFIQRKLDDGSIDRAIERISPQEQSKPAEFLVRARRDAILAKRHAGVTDRAIAAGLACELGGGVVSAHTLRAAIKKVFGPNGRGHHSPHKRVDRREHAS